MAIENLPEPRSPLPKPQSVVPTGGMSPRQWKDVYAEVVQLRKDLNSVLNHLKSSES